MSVIRVLLVDDHEIVRLGLMTLINDQENMEVVGEAGTAAEALRAVQELKPQVVLMDVRLPGEGGIEAGIQQGATDTASAPHPQVPGAGEGAGGAVRHDPGGSLHHDRSNSSGRVDV